MQNAKCKMQNYFALTTPNAPNHPNDPNAPNSSNSSNSSNTPNHPNHPKKPSPSILNLKKKYYICSLN